MTGSKLKLIRTDKGTEFSSKSRVHHEFTNFYISEQDKVSERANETILNCVC